MIFKESIDIEVPRDDSTSDEERAILYDEIKKHKPKSVVEIGTHRGLTTLYMAHALYENGEGIIHTADPFEWGAVGNFRKFPELEKHIRFYQKKGEELNDDLESIDFLFVDGFHEKDKVLIEIDRLFPLLTKGAIVYFHDTNGSNIYCDVPGAVSERGLTVEYLKTTNGMAKYVHKKTVGVDDNTTKDKEDVGKDTASEGADKLSKPRKTNRVSSRTVKSKAKRQTPND